MAKTVKPVKAKQAPKEKKTPVKVPVKKLAVKKEETLEDVIGPVIIPAEVPVTEKTPQVVMSVSDKEEAKRMKKYALLGGIDYYLNYIKGK